MGYINSFCNVYNYKQYAGAFALLTDISKRLDAEKKIKRNEVLFRALIENSFDGINMTDKDLKSFIVAFLQKNSPVGQPMRSQPKIAYKRFIPIIMNT